jgi:type II secretory pathway pseudopilin PulG
MLHRNYLTRAGAGRPAFTLIELIVMVAILATLAALAAGAVLRFITVQQQNNTRTALNKIQPIIVNRVSAIKDQGLKEAIPTNTMGIITASMSGNDPNYQARARTIYLKLKVRQMFPETFDEVFNPQVPGMGMQSYVNYLAQYGITAANSAGNGTGTAAGQYQYQSAVCLAMALQVGVGGGGVNMDDIGKGGQLATLPVDPAPGSPSAPMLIDAWGTPICYCRYPAGPNRVRNPQGPLTGTNDPLDPIGTLNNGVWGSSQAASTYQAVVLQRLTGQNNTSFNLWPVVVSAGPDKKFGLWMSPGPSGATSGYFDLSEIAPEANDNLYPDQ